MRVGLMLLVWGCSFVTVFAQYTREDEVLRMKAQQEELLKEPIGHLSFTYGPALSLGEFRETSLSETAGYAQNGAGFSASFGWRVLPILGVAVSFGSFYFPYNQDELVKDMLSSTNTANLSIEASTSSWEVQTLMTGINATWITEPLVFEGRLMAGLVGATSPHLSVLQQTPTEMLLEDFEPISSSSLGVGVGGGVRYVFLESFAASANVDYLYSYLRFEEGNYSNSRGQVGFYSMDRVIQAVHFHFGLSFVFVR